MKSLEVKIILESMIEDPVLGLDKIQKQMSPGMAQCLLNLLWRNVPGELRPTVVDGDLARALRIFFDSYPAGVSKILVKSALTEWGAWEFIEFGEWE